VTFETVLDKVILIVTIETVLDIMVQIVTFMQTVIHTLQMAIVAQPTTGQEAVQGVLELVGMARTMVALIKKVNEAITTKDR
jgi:hypothetical protein